MHYIYGLCDGNSAEAEREYAQRYPSRRHPGRRMIQNIHRLLCENGAFTSVSERALEYPVSTEEQVLYEIEQNSSLSTRRIGLRLNLPHASIWRILNRNLYHPFHRTPIQELSQVDKVTRKNFCRQMIKLNEEDPTFLRKVLWTDESTFSKTGVFNYHNDHLWTLENPHSTRIASTQYQFKANVWAGIIGHELIGPTILDGNTNAKNYLQLLQRNQPIIEESVPIQFRRDFIYQQDGAPAHFGLECRAWLDGNYPGRWIGRKGPYEWPARSPDLTPMDFYVWSVMKNYVYAVEIQDIEQLRERIYRAGRRLKRSLAKIDITEAVVRRFNLCYLNEGAHFEQLL